MSKDEYEKYKDLGYANGWGEKNPKEYDQCKKKGHTMDEISIGNCLSLYICHKCKIKYEVDSSG